MQVGQSIGPQCRGVHSWSSWLFEVVYRDRDSRLSAGIPSNLGRATGRPVSEPDDSYFVRIEYSPDSSENHISPKPCPNRLHCPELVSVGTRVPATSPSFSSPHRPSPLLAMAGGDLVPIGSLVHVLDRGFWGEHRFP